MNHHRTVKFRSNQLFIWSTKITAILKFMTIILKLLKDFEDLSGRNVSINLANLSGFKIFAEQQSEKPPEECLDLARKCLSNALEDMLNMQKCEGVATVSYTHLTLPTTVIV